MLGNIDNLYENGVRCLKAKDFRQALISFIKAAENNPFIIDGYIPFVHCMYALGEDRFLKTTLQKESRKSNNCPNIFNLHLFEKQLEFKNKNDQRDNEISYLFTSIAVILHRYNYLHESFVYYDYVNAQPGRKQAEFYNYFQSLLIDLGKRFNPYKKKSEQLCEKLKVQYPDEIKIMHDSLISSFYFGSKSNQEMRNQLRGLSQYEKEYPFIRLSRIEFELRETELVQNVETEISADFRYENIIPSLKQKRFELIKKNATKINYNKLILAQVRKNKQLLNEISSLHRQSVYQCLKNQLKTQQNTVKLQSAISFFKGIAFQQDQCSFNFYFLGLGQIAHSSWQQSIWAMLDAIQAEPAFINPYLVLAMIRNICVNMKGEESYLIQKLDDRLSDILKERRGDPSILLNIALFYKIIGNKQDYAKNRSELKNKQLNKQFLNHAYSQSKQQQIESRLQMRELQYLQDLAQKFQAFSEVTDLRLEIIKILLDNKQVEQVKHQLYWYYLIDKNQNNVQDQLGKCIAKYNKVIQISQTKPQLLTISEQTLKQLKDFFKEKLIRQIQQKIKKGLVIQPNQVIASDSGNVRNSTNNSQNLYENSSMEKSHFDIFQNHENSALHDKKIYKSFAGKPGTSLSKFLAYSTSLFIDPNIYKHLNYLFFQLEYQLYHYVASETREALNKASQYIIRHLSISSSYQLSEENFKLSLTIEKGEVFISQYKQHTQKEVEQVQARLNEIVGCLESLGIYHGDIEWPNLIQVQKKLKITDFDLALVYKNVSKKSEKPFSKLCQILGFVLDLNLKNETKSAYLYPLKYIFFGKYNNQQLFLQQFSSVLKQIFNIKLQYDQKSGSKQACVKKYLDLLQKIVPQVHHKFVNLLVNKLKVKKQTYQP